MEYTKKKFKYNNKGKKGEENKNSKLNDKKEEKNILDYFILGEDEDKVEIISEFNKNENSDENNIEENNENNKKIKYNVNSFITSNYRPDLYSPLGIIGGNKYNLKNNSIQKIENDTEEKEENEEEKEDEKEEEKEEEEKGESEEKESDILEKKEDKKIEELEKYKLLKLGRYYILDEDITVKCHNCGEVGHVKDFCPYTNLKFCHRCLSHAHNDKDCKNKKCFRCNKSGHNKNECDIKESDILICFNCGNSGHRKNECLINPVEIEPKYIKNNGLSCFNCGSTNHLICPLSDRENIELNKESVNFSEIDEEEMENSNDQEISSETPMEEDKDEIKKNSKKQKKKTKKIFDDLKNEDIKFTIFCSYCGERHRNENCPLKNDPKFSNEFDIFRKNICSKILEKRQKENEEKQRLSNLQKKRKRENSSNNLKDFKNKNKDKRNNFLYIDNINNMEPFLSYNEAEEEGKSKPNNKRKKYS